MNITRGSIVRGPGSVMLGATALHDKGGITASFEQVTFDVDTSAWGKVDTLRGGRIAKVSWTPARFVNAGILAALYPRQSPNIGASIFGGADVPCVVHSKLGKKVTFFASALTKRPSLRLSGSVADLFASGAEITCVNKDNTDPTDAASFFSITDEAWAGSASAADIHPGRYVGTYDQTALNTKDGWTVDFEDAFDPVPVDGIGTVDMDEKSSVVRAKCTPTGLSEADIMAMFNLQGAGAAPGSSMRSGKTLTIAAAGGLTVILYEAAVMVGPLNWGAGTLRIGEIGFIAHRSITNNTPGALCSVALTP